MDEKDKEFTEQLFFNQMNEFQNDTAEKIIDLLNEKKYILDVSVLGLIATARALIITYAEDDKVAEALLDTAKYMLEQAQDGTIIPPSE